MDLAWNPNTWDGWASEGSDWGLESNLKPLHLLSHLLSPASTLSSLWLFLLFSIHRTELLTAPTFYKSYYNSHRNSVLIRFKNPGGELNWLVQMDLRAHHGSVSCGSRLGYVVLTWSVILSKLLPYLWVKGRRGWQFPEKRKVEYNSLKWEGEKAFLRIPSNKCLQIMFYFLLSHEIKCLQDYVPHT